MLTTLEHLKTWLGITSTQDDALLTELIARCSALIERYLNRTVLDHSVHERRAGHDKNSLLFQEYPVTTVDRVVVDGHVLASSDYYATATTLHRLGSGVFPAGQGNIELDYNAGYAEVPADIEQACLEIAALRYKERERIGQQSKSLAGETVSFYLQALSPTAKAALNQYRSVVAAA